MRRHEEYRDSGVFFLGEIPKHWRNLRLKFAVKSLETGGTPDTGEERFWAQGKEGIPWVSISDMTGTYALSRTAKRITEEGRASKNLQVLPPGSLLYSIYASLGKVAVLESPGTVNQAILGIVPDSSLVTQPYLSWWLRYMERHVVHLSSSNTQDNLSAERVRGMPVYLPPLGEQRLIADFLDRETAKIDALIDQKQRLIDLLQEKRAALITRAVTKGLDPDVEMKDSGVEWLPRIPLHWDAAGLKYLSTLQTGLTLGKEYKNRDLVLRPYLRVANVQAGYLHLDDVTEIEVPKATVQRYELRHGDVLMTEGGDFDKLGRGCVWEGQVTGCLHQNHIFAVRPDLKQLDPYYLAAVLESGHGRKYFTATSKQSTNLASTNSTKVRNFPLPVPPLDEQQSIVRQLRDETQRLGILTDEIERAITLLHEYRTALISAAVIGKIDVREAA